MNRRQGLALGLIIIIIIGAVIVFSTGLIPIPSFLTGGGATSGTYTTITSGSSTFTTLLPPTNPISGTTTTTGNGTSNIKGLQQALAGNSGLNNFLNARSCGLVNIGYVIFCDTFQNGVDASRWATFGGPITVTYTTNSDSTKTANVQFDNATMRSKMGFYYGKFGVFTIEVSPQPPTYGSNCPKGWFVGEDIHGRWACFDHAIWGFGRIDGGDNATWGIYWEQTDQIRTVTRYQDFRSGVTIMEVSAWQPLPGGVVDYAINWNIDSHGAYVDFYYHQHDGGNTVVNFSHHSQAIPKTFLYLFAASSGTSLTLHRVIILPAWRPGTSFPLEGLMTRPEELSS